MKRLAALLLALSFFPVAALAQTILRYSDHEPLDGMRPKFIKDVLFAAIEKESSGRLKIEDHWDGSVATGYDALRVAGEGKLTDMAVVVPEYSAGTLPLHQLFKSFPTGPSGARQVDFFRRSYAGIPALTAELQRNHVVPVFLATGYPVAFLSRPPLDALTGIERHTWRSASFWHQDFLRNAGATPRSIPWGDAVFNAMRDQTLDGLMVNADSAYMLKIHELAPNILMARNLWLGHLYVVAMNRDTWDGLEARDQQAIRRAAESAYAQLGPVMDDNFDAMVGDLRNAGAKVRLLSREEVAAWRGATRYREVQAAWVADQRGKGVDAGPVLEQMTDLLRTTTGSD